MKNSIIKNIIKQIEDTRALMHSLIYKREFNLLDPEVIQVSQELDSLLSKYENVKQYI